MTTGRINQVTILDAKPGTRGPPGQLNPPKRAEVVKPEGPGHGVAGRPPTALFQLREGSRQAIHLPPLSSPRRGPPQNWAGPPEEAPPNCNMHPSRGGRRSPVTSKDPEASQRLLTTAYPQTSDEIFSQGPTIHRPHRARKAVPFGVRLPSPTRGVVRGDAGTPRPVRAVGPCLDWSVLRQLSLRLKVLQVRTKCSSDRAGRPELQG